MCAYKRSISIDLLLYFHLFVPQSVSIYSLLNLLLLNCNTIFDLILLLRDEVIVQLKLKKF